MKARWILLAVCLGLAALVAIPVAQADSDDEDDDSAALVGTWRFTGFAPGAGSFFDYLIFHEDKTLTERSAFDIESIGSGVWDKIDSDTDSDSDSDSDDAAHYAAMFETFRDNDADGSYDARTRARITVQVDGDTLTGTGTIEFRTLEENALFAGPFPGATFEATRMKLIRE